MQHEWLPDVLGLAQHFLDVHAVIADGGVGVGARGGEIGEQPAQAIADGAHFARAAGQSAQMGDGGLDVFHAIAGIEAVHQVEGAFPFGLAFVGELDIGFEPPEQIRRQREIAPRRQTVGHGAHEAVHPENFLDDDNSGAAACGRRRQIGAEAAVRRVDGDVLAGHGFRSFARVAQG